MDEEEKRVKNRERVKKHRAIQANVKAVMNKRSRHESRQGFDREESSSQSRESAKLEKSDVDGSEKFVRELSRAHDPSIVDDVNREQLQLLAAAELIHDARQSVGELMPEHQVHERQMSVDDEAAMLQDAEVQAEVRSDEESSLSDVNEENEHARNIDEAEGNDEQDRVRIIDDQNIELAATEEIRNWAIESNIPHNKLDQLLAILKRRFLPNLPKSSKTFLKTAGARYTIYRMEASDGSVGEFVYFGIAQGLLACIQRELHTDGTILLQINVDGMNLFKSGVKQFWPILCKVYFDPDIFEPFPVATFSGNAKPRSVNEFLEDFVHELNQLLAEGIQIMGFQYQVRIQCFICDTPARSFLKCVKSHGGYWACERCETRGERIDNRTVYPEVDAEKRTDRSFRIQTQREHHCGQSPLLAIEPPIDLVSTFVLDYMHLCCIGIMKKLTEFWVFGKMQTRLQRRNKLGLHQRNKLSNRMLQLKPCIPEEFQRKPRSLNRIAQWKATEFRFFLLYCGPIVLRGVLNPDLYKHYLLFHTACRILSNAELAFTCNDHAQMYLTTFFGLMDVFYGRRSQIMNAHNLIHMASDVKNMHCTLSQISAFPFESVLGKMRLHLRNANRPLAQVCRRLYEVAITKKKPSIPPIIQILKSKNDPHNNSISIRKLKYKGYVLTTKIPNNLVMLNNDVLVSITAISCLQEDPQNVEIEGNEWKMKSSIFKYPTNSRNMKMVQLASRSTTRIVRCNVYNVQRKMVQLKISGTRPRGDRKVYAIPFLHE